MLIFLDTVVISFELVFDYFELVCINVVWWCVRWPCCVRHDWVRGCGVYVVASWGGCGAGVACAGVWED